MYNIASILLGLGALALPTGALLRRSHLRTGGVFTTFSLCAAALLCQFLELHRRVRAEDLAGVEDTIAAVCIAAAALCALALGLTLAAILRRK